MQAKIGDQVKVHYTGSLDNGTVFDSSRERDCLEFIIGKQEVIPGFEQAVTGMVVGETKSVRIECENAYGPHQETLVFEFSRERFPPDVKPQVGQQLQMTTQEGQNMPVLVTEVGGSAVTLDANHPLAGQNLNFELELVAIA